MKLKNVLILSLLFLVIGSISIGRYNKEKLAAGVGLISAEGDIGVKAENPNISHDETEEIDNPAEFDNAGDSTEERAEKIARAVNEFEDIEKVSVIITGNSAIIGIDLKGELTDQKLIELKRDAERKVKSVDSSLDHVAVTAVSELIDRMDKIADYSTPIEENNNLDAEQEEKINAMTPVV